MKMPLLSSLQRWRRNASTILGINRRNLEYIYPRNARSRFPLVDDKIRAKEIFARVGLPMPETYAVADTRADITAALDAVGRHRTFVVKPARGYGGGGIVAVRPPTGGQQAEPGRPKAEPSRQEAQPSHGEAEPSRQQAEPSREELAFHMAAILSGMFSLDSERDRVLVEELVVEHPALRLLHGNHGVSDIRVIVVDGKAVMAMLRVPCLESRPTANLHRGGIGIGIDLASGRTTFAVQRGRPVTLHPDTGIALAGIEVPFWREALAMAEPLSGAFGLGYLGADVVLHADRGPLMLEVNARPGLTIQIANMRGLRLDLGDGRDEEGGEK